MKGRCEDGTEKEKQSSGEGTSEAGTDKDKANETNSGSQVESNTADQPGISYLSCASFPVTSTLSEAVQRAAHLRGEPVVIIVTISGCGNNSHACSICFSKECATLWVGKGLSSTPTSMFIPSFGGVPPHVYL